jgi:hypothetical protein
MDALLTGKWFQLYYRAKEGRAGEIRDATKGRRGL